MTLKSIIALSLHRGFILLYSTVFIVVLLLSSSHILQRQQSEQLVQSQTIVNALMQQITLPLIPIINSFDNSDDSNQQILAILKPLVQQPGILDATVYQLDGTLIAHSGPVANVKERLNLENKSTEPNNYRQLVKKIDDENGPIGFIRLTIDNDLLLPVVQRSNNTIHLIWLFIVLAGLMGLIMGRVLYGHKS